PLTPEVVSAFATCIQCRGCEPACPSGVPYGRLIERTQETLAENHAATPRWLRVALWGVTRPRLLRPATRGLAVAQRIRVVPDRFAVPRRLPLRDSRLRASGSDVHLVTGCVMDAWQRDVHRAAQRVLTAAGFGVLPTNDTIPCCGALHTHAGL